MNKNDMDKGRLKTNRGNYMKKRMQILFLILICISGVTKGNNPSMGSDRNSWQNQEMAVSLTFQDYNAEEAMNFYVGLFHDSKIIDIQRWGKGGPGKEGTVMTASFELNGMKFICSDSPPVHNWTFTPAVSIYIESENEEEIEALFSKLSKDGNVAMPLDDYGFSQKFGWVIDRFGVSWQLNLK
jgi:predicted 3-demethylubiquinone-9 3-methyltransferase (glyoxalase superfamily)